MNFSEFIKKYNWIILSVTAIVFLILLIWLNQKEKPIPDVPQVNIVKTQYDYSELSKIIAKSYYVYDINEDEVIFSKNEHDKLPLASITKLMSGLVIKNHLPSTTTIEVGLNAIKREGDSGFAVGERWQLKKLLDFSLITSSNDGMCALASALNAYEAVSNKNTVSLMNEKAKEILLNDSTFMNEDGLDVDVDNSGAYSSSYDTAHLLAYIINNNPDLVSATVEEKEKIISDSNISHEAKNTNISINRIPAIIASKTGYTELAGGNLAVVYDAGFMHPVAVVVLGSTQEGRFSDVETLVKMSLQKLSE